MDLRVLYGIELNEAQLVLQGYGEPAYRAAQLLEWLYSRHAERWEEFSNLPKPLLEKLKFEFSLKALTSREILPSPGGQSTKFLFQTQDGHLLESVLITQQDRRTVCVSTQLGCKMRCAFCASGKSFVRSLTAGEIVEQAVWIERSLRGAPPKQFPSRRPGLNPASEPGIASTSLGALSRNDEYRRVTNIVFMGMGEPLDNLEATLKAIRIFQADWGFGLGGRRITVSTVGITPKMEEFVKRTDGRVRLSVSLHSSNEKTRSEIVPLNRVYSLKDLAKTLQDIFLPRSSRGGKTHPYLKREITFEYTLLEGINDSREEALGAARIARPLGAKINLIPYNPIRDAEGRRGLNPASLRNFKRPSLRRIRAFREILQKGGIRVTVRQTAGRDIDAACGQLCLDRTS